MLHDLTTLDWIVRYLILAIVGWTWWLLRAQAKQAEKDNEGRARFEEQVTADVADRQTRIIETQERISEILDNHLSEIAKHMALSTATLRDLNDIGEKATEYMAVTSQAIKLIQDRLLDAVIVPKGTAITLETKPTPEAKE